MKHIPKATKPHGCMRLRGGVDHSLALIFFGILMLLLLLINVLWNLAAFKVSGFCVAYMLVHDHQASRGDVEKTEASLVAFQCG
jgi:hypothetical protein